MEYGSDSSTETSLSKRPSDSSSSSDSEEDAKPAAGTKEVVASLSQNEAGLSAPAFSSPKQRWRQQQQQRQQHQQPPTLDPSLAMWGPLPPAALESSRQAQSEYEQLPTLASTSVSSAASQQQQQQQQQQLQQLERAALLQRELQRQEEMLRLQLSLGLLDSSSAPTVLPDQVLQAALVSGLNSNNAFSLLQQQQQPQQHPLLNPLGQMQPNLWASNVSAAFQAQQVQLEQQRQQQFLTAAALSMPSSTQLDSSLALRLALGSNPQVSALSGLSHLPQTVVQPSRGASMDQQFSPSRASSQSSQPKQEPTSSEPLMRPKRPLTAYNLFFKARREQLLAEQQQQHNAASDRDHNQQQQQQQQQDEAQQQKPRPRRNSIGFEDLAKIIGKEWKEIDPQTLAEYEAEAKKDKERYLRESQVYKASRNAQLEAKRAAMEQSVSDEVRQRYFAEVSGKKRKRR